MAFRIVKLVAFLGRLCIILAIHVGYSSRAESIFDRKNVDTIPNGLSPKDAQEWKDATCKWRIVNDDEHVGMGGSGSAISCFAQARIMMIYVDQNPEVDSSVKKSYRNDLLIIFDGHQGHQEVCHSLPVKDPYDKITFEDFAKDTNENGGEPSAAFLNRLNESIQLQCLMM